MSRIETVTITCDLQQHEGSVPAITHAVSIDGNAIEIDMCASCLLLLTGFLEAGRKPKAARPAPSRTAASRARAAAVRAWAEDQGLLGFPSRGRIPDYVIAHYDAEHGGAR